MSSSSSKHSELIRGIKERNENAIICDWEKHQLPADQIVAGKKVLWLANVTRRTYYRLRLQHTDWSDEEIRKKMIETEPVLKSFQGTHRTLFETFTSRETGQEQLLRIIQLIKMRIRHEKTPGNDEANGMEAFHFMYGKYLKKPDDAS